MEYTRFYTHLSSSGRKRTLSFAIGQSTELNNPVRNIVADFPLDPPSRWTQLSHCASQLLQLGFVAV
jgi:hypothetical protein